MLVGVMYVLTERRIACTYQVSVPPFAVKQAAAGSVRPIPTRTGGGCHKADYTRGAGPPPGSSNITPVGLGTWSERDFLRAMREHVRPNGLALDPSMPRAFGGMTDAELHAIYTYLQTVPAKGEKTNRQM